jgi:hypothetical protein
VLILTKLRTAKESNCKKYFWNGASKSTHYYYNVEGFRWSSWIGSWDRIYVRNTWYSVISPESCSSILWKSWVQRTRLRLWNWLLLTWKAKINWRYHTRTTRWRTLR